MSESLDALFGPDSPPPPRLPRSASRSQTPPSPQRRSNKSDNPLFLSPGNSSFHGTPASRHKRPASPPPPRSRVPIPAPVFDDPLPLRDGHQSEVDLLGAFDPFAGLNGNEVDLEVDGGGGKKRRVMAKIDADRLLSERGFPALVKSAKKFRLKGKGHEAADLKALLDVYQMWAHGMFPKGDFAGTIQRVETVCRTRRMENAMKGYKEAFYPPPKSPTPLPKHNGEGDDRLTPALSDRASPEMDDRESRPAAVQKEPLFDRGDDAEEDGGVDMDELMALEEMEREGEVRRDEVDAPPRLPRVEGEDEWEGLYD